MTRPIPRRRSNLVSWLVGTMPKVWMHQKLWRKFAIIEVALAFYCAWDGAWESINSVHQTAPGRSSVVNISHHHQFPKQQLPPQEKKRAIVKSISTLGYFHVLEVHLVLQKSVFELLARSLSSRRHKEGPSTRHICDT